MIQELLSAVVEERKFSFTGGGLLSDAPSPFLSSASAAASIQSSSTPSPSAIPEPPQQKLRCPRCDSSNTKFCYYNNYNLTQPRHFCKTCRRYWTKGGALRNVPIGGGCRKSKPSPNIAPGGCSGKPGSASKSCKPISSIEAIARAGFGLESDLFQPSPIIWAAPPPHHNSHLLALLRAGGGSGSGFRNFDPNPLHNLSSIRIKEEVIAPESVGHGTGQPGPSYDPLGQFSSGVGSLWRNDGQLQYLQLQENTSPFGDSSAGIQELYQRLRPQAGPMMAGSYCSDQLSMSSDGYGMAPACSPSTPSTAITSSIAGGGGASTAQVLATVQPIMGAEFGYWNPTLPWSDMSSAN